MSSLTPEQRFAVFQRSLILSGLLLLGGCGDSPEDDQTTTRFGHYLSPTVELPAEALPGGSTSHVGLKPGSALSVDAFSQPSANLPASQLGLFAVGNSFFSNAWVSAPASVSARDGLGPLFSAASCQDCHIRDGRGHLPAGPQTAISAAALRIARPDGQPDPAYGSHLQLRAVAGVAAEARVQVHWQTRIFTLPDGSQIPLRRPRLQTQDWAYGEPAADLAISPRVAPAMIGLGLLEAIEAERLRSKPGSGRLNQVPDLLSGKLSVGRFGWKASQPTVRQQALDAFVNDLGITSRLRPAQPCSSVQRACRQASHGGEPELTDAVDEAVSFYARHLAPPARRDHDRPEVRQGEKLFHQLGCASCHTPHWRTSAQATHPQLADQLIWPYSDLRLHDMGAELADGIVEHAAGGRDWRTPPLWGLAHSKTVAGAQSGFLHDGRARDLREAILWHGGEAEAARDAWAALPAPQRRLLIRFLASL